MPYLHLIAFITIYEWLVAELYFVKVIFWAYLKACNIHVWGFVMEYRKKTFVFS